MENRNDSDGYIRRFSPFRIGEHWLNAMIFGILVLTGLPQKFYSYDLSQSIILSLGGIDSTRLIHRMSGLLLAVVTVQHVFGATFGVLFRKWAPTMLISKKDFTDNLDNIKYYLKLGDRPASCDRYDYRQKFEYWGVVVGGMLMIGTGLALWFPAVVSRFLPAALIPSARALHTNEALLAFLVIVIWHIYNAVFSPEVFPLDTAIFTGRMSRQRMAHEHPVELAGIDGVALQEITDQHHEDAPFQDAQYAKGASRDTA